MFKLESYITPLLLSYVDRYIKNFRPEDSQVSLWGGDASFHNLDLRLEVLEQLLQLPFSFVSGHIHELLIHVPWTKLASEPITITINTIECILKLRGAESSRSSDSSQKDRQRKTSSKRHEVQTPPGYVESLVKKIVGNIRIYCNNLILKYVEEDIVLSMNVKLLMFESANEKWEPAYLDYFPAQVTIRKLITINDLTVCLDKRNSSGKIDVYQEPMLYRCSFVMHLLQNYYSSSKRASTIRLDVYCNSMEFSMTEQQIPMFIRLILLLCALKEKEYKSNTEVNADDDQYDLAEQSDVGVSWASWAWSYVPAILSTHDESQDEQPVIPTGHTLHIGVYIDNASLSFKLSESSNERGYYSQRKLKYWPILTLRLQGLFSEFIMHGVKWINVSSGISQILLIPVGSCTCSQIDIPENTTTLEYLNAGLNSDAHKANSLFDAEALENKGQKRLYNISWDYHMSHVTESTLLDKTPAFAVDYVHDLLIPDDMTNEQLSDLGSDYEYSNVSVRTLCRIVVGPLRMRLCAGLVHRLQSLWAAASAYDYPPYTTPKKIPSRIELPPPSEDDYDALNENIPMGIVQYTIIAPVIEFYLFDHPFFEASKDNLFKKRKKMSTPPSSAPQDNLPKLTLECQCVDAKLQQPIYLRRLLETVCQLPEPPTHMFEACFETRSVKLIGFCSRLILPSNKQTTIIIPFNASYQTKNILHPEYWTNSDTAYSEMDFHSDSITVTGTKPKMMLVAIIIDKFIKLNSEDALSYVANTSLLNHATKDSCMSNLELCIEDVKLRKVVTKSTFAMDLSLFSIKAFIFDPVEFYFPPKDMAKTSPSDLENVSSNYSFYSTREMQQVLFISGPEWKDGNIDRRDIPLFKATVQFPLEPTIQCHPTILMFNLQEVRICVDPLVCQWFLYSPKTYQARTDFIYDSGQRKNKNVSEASSGLTDVPRRLGTPHESIHSNSDREPAFTQRIPKTTKDDDLPDLQERVYNFLKKWFSVWKGMLLFGDISQCTIYFPVSSLSAVGSQGIQQAIDEAMKKKDSPDILVITLPLAKIRSSANKQNLLKHIKVLPVKFPKSDWSSAKSNFPWSISISDISCYSYQNGVKLNFFTSASLNATVGLSAKSKTELKTVKSEENTASNLHMKSSMKSDASSTESIKSDLGSLGICVHIDITPVNISMSEVQVCLIASILCGLLEVFNSISPEPCAEPLKSPDTLPVISAQSTTTSPTLFKESTLDSISEQNPQHVEVNVQAIDSDNVKLTAWIQCTITRFSVEILSYKIEDFCSDGFSYMQKPNLKLVIEAEDIVSSLDFQNVYLKIKSKVGSASIQHYVFDKIRRKWKPGPFLGFVMKTREEVASSERQEDTSFANIIVTRASCQHTHNLWGTTRKTKPKDNKDDNADEVMPTRFITEIVVTLQPIDFLFSLTTLRNFYIIFEPLVQIAATSKTTKPSNLSAQVNNKILPLAYLDCKGFRIIVPSVELGQKEAAHDVCIFQVDSIGLLPDPINPICRTPLRPDIYQQAARARILNIPGSEIEDRQYELNVKGISLSTSTWEEFDPFLHLHSSVVSHLKTMNENPALEWNLGKGQHSSNQSMSLWPVINKFDLLVIVAPVMIYKSDVVCGHSIEINFVSNIDINISISQLKLASALHHEFNSVFDLLMNGNQVSKRPKVYLPYMTSRMALWDNENIQESCDGFRDSGFETSDLRSSISLKTKESPSQIRKVSESEKSSLMFPKTTTGIPSAYAFVPLDVLVTSGKISLILYQFSNGDEKKVTKFSHKKHKPLLKDLDKERGYEGSEEGSIDERLDLKIKKFQPLIFVSLSQPNIFVSDLQLGRKIQVSCFDVGVKMSGAEYQPLKGIPNEADFPINLLETRRGVPNPSTGVSPAFFTLKWSRGISKPSLDIDVAKPTKILCSLSRWAFLFTVKNRILEALDLPACAKPSEKNDNEDVILKPTTHLRLLKNQRSIDNYSKFKQIKEKLQGITVLNIKFAQIMFTVQTENKTEVTLSVAKLRNNLHISNRPERIVNVIGLDCCTISVTVNEVTRLLLNPWTISVETSLFWESWQSIDSNPQIQVSAESDSIMIDVSPSQLQCLEMVQKEITEFLQNMFEKVDLEDSTSVEITRLPPSDKEQHYKDDLRAGAFHFVDSTSNNIDELPLPYQVMFWNKNISAMAWRYPQPRALTKIRVFPVPFKITTGNQEDQQVLCHLEYWSDCHGSYLPYTQFYLSESEMCHLELPRKNQPVVAYTWRIVLSTPNDNFEDESRGRVLISPRALAGCIRVDSYFNKILVPEVTLTLHVTTISISLFNHIDKSLPIVMPETVQPFMSDLMFPETQCFLILTLDNASIYLATWNFETVEFDVNAVLKCNILDYNYLTQQSFIEPFAFKLEICISKTLNINCIAKAIHFKFGASAAHTLAVSAQMWEESFRNKENLLQPFTNLVLMTHYVICNDTNATLRFGQAGYEDIILPSRHCHFYCWRSQKLKQMIRVALEEYRWSELFRIDNEGTEMCKIPEGPNLMIVVTVKSLSATQKQVIFSGQLIICNTLTDHFELKVLEAYGKDKDKDFKTSPVHIISGKSTPPSILINSLRKHFLRLRFFGLESAWSGDIPLMENTKCAQPWLVKIPLQERGQFLSIWCRIVIQDFPKGLKILAVLWPLFMVRSNLPVNTKVHIETPTLNANLESNVRGRGEYQQLYCPGTIDHSHQLSFQLDDTPTSNPYVPLNYSLVDQNEFFKKSNNEDINEILTVLHSYDKSDWPYFGNEFDELEYIIEDQPLTHVQVRYQNACQYSSALLVELLPWCLLLNTLGCPIAIIINEKELCRISHYGICTPPKLEETFCLGVGIGGTWNLSPPLQVAKSDWSQTFYMPKINGTIPINGNIKTVVKCDPYICMVSITSNIENEIRLLRISSTHVLINNTGIQLYGVCFAVPDNGICYDIPKKLEKYSFAISPHLNKSNSGLSITEWYVIGANVDANVDYVFYISLSVNSNLEWSCPVRVDKSFMRRSISVQNEQSSIPLVLVGHEHKGQMYMSLHHDLYPQLLIHNRSGMKLFCAQYSDSESRTIYEECDFLKWLCGIDNESSKYYTMPSISEQFPEIANNNSDQLVLASDPEGDPQGFQWSTPFNTMNFNDQFVRIPFYGDVRVCIKSCAHTNIVRIESVSQVEISARDIRVRLSIHESENMITDSQKKSSPDLLVQHEPVWKTDVKDSETDTLASTYFSAQDCLPSSSNSSVRDRQLHISRTLPTLAENSHVQVDTRRNVSAPSLDFSQDALVLPQRSSRERSNFKILLFLKSIIVTLTSDLENGGIEKTEILALSCDNISVCVNKNEVMEVKLSIGEIQLDNQLFHRGSYDFPVVLIGQNITPIQPLNTLNGPIQQLINSTQEKALISVVANFEFWKDEVQQINITDLTDIKIRIQPLLMYVEDTYVTKVVDYLSILVPNKLVVCPKREIKSFSSFNTVIVQVPQQIIFETEILAKPLKLRNFVIEEISLLLSVHSSIKLYIALDQSSLQFAKFEKKRLMTTSYRLGHAIAMHYLSGAIFGAGWVVGSLELLGSPGGLARAMGSGLWDFINMPYTGLAHGPWAFIIGIIQGSRSLMKHITAGTLQSVTKLASSVARNLDRLTLDEEHLRRTEEQRRIRPQGVAQGFVQGLTGLGISLLGAVGGIAHHPLQSVMSEGASPRSLVAGVGLGLVGVFTKPLSGAADLVALTGQGLLQGAGWNPLPEARMKPTICHSYSSTNSILKYNWKFMQPIVKENILFVTEATSITNFGQYEAVALVLTLDTLIIINTDDDMSQRTLRLSDLTGIDNSSDPTLLTLKLSSQKPMTSKPKIDDEGVIEMDPASRARIADYVKNTAGLMNFSDNQSSEHSEISISPDLSGEDTTEESQKEQAALVFYVNPQSRNYFLCLISLAKLQHETYNFPVF